MNSDAVLLRWLPLKTTSVAERQLRERALPAFLDFLDSHYPRFGSAESESHAFRTMDDEARRRLWGLWRSDVSPLLVGMMSNADHLDICVALLARAIQLFRDRPTGVDLLVDRAFQVTVSQSLPSLASRLGSMAPQPLHRFIAEAASSASVAHIEYKGRLYSGVVIDSKCTLKDEALHYMYERLGPLFRSLPGHVPDDGSFSVLERPQRDFNGHLIRNARNVGPFIHRLFSNRVFDEISEYRRVC